MKIKKEETKERFIDGAWIGFQMGAGGDKNFGQYLESVGLTDGHHAEEVPITKEEAIKKAEHIKELLNKG